MKKIGDKGRIALFSLFLFIIFALIVVGGNYNFKQLEAEVDKKISHFTKLPAEDARQLTLQELIKEKQYHKKMQLW